MAYSYRTTEFLDGKELLITRIVQGKPSARGHEVTIYGTVDGDYFYHTFGAGAKAGKDAIGLESKVPAWVSFTKVGRSVDLAYL